jgi:hypothetical protein
MPRGRKEVAVWARLRWIGQAPIRERSSREGLALRVAAVQGVAELQLFDNAQKQVIQQVALNQAKQVQIKGAAYASDLLMVDLSYTGGGTAEPINVLFDGGVPAQAVTDKVLATARTVENLCIESLTSRGHSYEMLETIDAA